MAANNVMFQQMPMGSHATAGGPHPTTGQPAAAVTQIPVQQQAPQQMSMPQKPVVQQAPLQPPMPTAPAVVAPQMQQAGPAGFEVLGSTPVMSTEYTQGYLKSQIGKRVKINFLIGTDNITDRSGTLTNVGISYIIILEEDTDDLMLCDIYSIKFVTFYQ